jgi:hypothetical protein
LAAASAELEAAKRYYAAAKAAVALEAAKVEAVAKAAEALEAAKVEAAAKAAALAVARAAFETDTTPAAFRVHAAQPIIEESTDEPSDEPTAQLIVEVSSRALEPTPVEDAAAAEAVPVEAAGLIRRV